MMLVLLEGFIGRRRIEEVGIRAGVRGGGDVRIPA
jgi:hypothetical protein